LDLPDLALFVAVARRRSFARVAAERGISRSAVSHAMRTLEARLGVRLLNRTTRSVTPTEIGASLLSRLEPAIGAVADALEAVNAYRDTPMGTLKLNMPRGAAQPVASLIGPFLRANPAIRLEIVTDDGFVDIVRDGFDAGVRFGESLARDMIAIPLGPPQRFAVVGSPDYFTRYPVPQTPEALSVHDCIGRRFPAGALYAWELEKDGRSLNVAVEGRTVFDDNGLILAAAREGLGLAQVFEHEVAKDLKSGALIRVLEDWCPSFPGYHLYYTGGRQTPGPLRALIDFINKEVKRYRP
jgi:DNA-binding transcriptional LysR family regulator